VSTVLTPRTENEVPPRRMTVEEFLALPEEEGITLEYVDGELVERPMTTRSAGHGRAITHTARAIAEWLDDHPGIGGDVGSGEVRCRISRDPDIIVGLDVGYFDETVVELLEDDKRLFDGPPIVAVEVVSPTDSHERLVQRIHELLDAGVKQVWLADPDFLTVTVHRADAEPTFFSARQELDGGAELPGFRAVVERLFRRVRPRPSVGSGQ
jgi:Uma2 family endonuclease